MQVYFAPLACSMASRIVLDELGVEAEFVEVDTATKRLLPGGDFRAVNPLGLVPALRTDDGRIITENAAILQALTDHPGSALAPRDAAERSELQRWLCFIGTELHISVFTPLLDSKAPEGARDYAVSKAPARLGLLDRHLAGRDFLLDRFSAADAYLFVVLTWSRATPQLTLNDWPNVRAYHRRLRARPSIARALELEMKLYEAEQARREAA